MRLQLDEEDETGISLAPLIDVVFLLLIFFLVASVLEKPVRQVAVSVPRMESARPFDAKNASPRVIVVDSRGAFHVDGCPVDRTELLAVLDVLAQVQSGARLRLDVDEKAPVQYLAEILEMLRQRGITNFGLRAKGGNLPR
jgi:biopolymer transport protein ExbD